MYGPRRPYRGSRVTSEGRGRMDPVAATRLQGDELGEGCMDPIPESVSDFRQNDVVRGRLIALQGDGRISFITIVLSRSGRRGRPFWGSC